MVISRETRLQIFKIARIVRGETLFAAIEKTMGHVPFALCKLRLRAWGIERACVALNKLLFAKLGLDDSSSAEIQKLYNIASF